MSEERIIGDYTGSTFKDFLILPGHTQKDCTPDTVSIETSLAGVNFRRPFLPAAMRSVVGKEMALNASKNGMMPVAPRGLSIDDEAGIIDHVKRNEVRPGDIEIERDPVYVFDTATLGEALETTRRHGHSNVPVKSRMAELVGMFTYKPVAHDLQDPDTPITSVMTPFKVEGQPAMPVVRNGEGNDEIKRYMSTLNLRMIPVLDGQDRLEALIFMQLGEAYKVGAAIDTRPGWIDRVQAMAQAGADMIFIDTSDAHSDFVHDVVLEYNGQLKATGEVVRRYKGEFGPPICAGNVVTQGGCRFLLDAGADAVKEGMGSGSICTTNVVLGVGAPPMWATIEVAKARDRYFKETGRYAPIITDGGIEDTWDINVALTHADAIMGGRIFAGFHESAGEEMIIGGRRVKVYYGEGSRLALMASGNLDRYHLGSKEPTPGLYQGVPGTVPYAGYLKPGVELYSTALREAMSHAGAHNLGEFRKSRLIRLTEQAGRIARPHGIAVLGD